MDSLDKRISDPYMRIGDPVNKRISDPIDTVAVGKWQQTPPDTTKGKS
jgi:hypothetical protein